MRFARERFGAVWNEVSPMLEAHLKETGLRETISPKLGVFEMLEASGVLRVFVARGDDGAVHGYSVFVVSEHLLFGCRIAVEQAIYMKPEWRGALSGKFLKWIDGQLEADNVDQIQRTVSRGNPRFYGALSKLGYEPGEIILIRRL